jgi:hydroxyethylthiazole kinase-like uncharacterized protein yjeF
MDRDSQPRYPTARKDDTDRAPNPKSARSENMVVEMSVENCRKLDDFAVDKYGIPSIVLMENAAIGITKNAIEMLDQLGDDSTSSIIIFCGPGNNGGDGFAVARHLNNAGYNTQIITTHAPGQLPTDAQTNFDIITKMSLLITSAENYLAHPSTTDSLKPVLIIDALFGSGLSRPIAGAASQLVTKINCFHSASVPVLSIDTPSGLDAQTGLPYSDSVVRADRTVTLAALKEGLATIEAQPYTGEVFVEPIGIPRELLASLGRPTKHRARHSY